MTQRINVLMLMAGESDAFKESGAVYPKNLIEIDGYPMVQWAMNKMDVLNWPKSSLICCVQKSENRMYHTGAVIQLLRPEAKVIEVPGKTSGAACTALLAVEHINTKEPLLIINSDQIIEHSIDKMISEFTNQNLDGGIGVFESVHPRWSYVRLDQDGFVVETAEKRPISHLATAGVYYFKEGRSFVESAQSMIKKDAHVNGVFYVCPAYNEFILKGAKIGVSTIAKSAYFSLTNRSGVSKYEEYLRRHSYS